MIYVILGQTASGKTGLVSKLARELNLPVINADAFQIYDKLDIGSAKPTKQEMEGIDFNLVGTCSILNDYSVKEYQLQARELIDKYILQGKDIILSGGTFLYVKAALFNYEFNKEEIDPTLEELDNDTLFKMLEELDYQTSLIIDKNNKRRLVRAVNMAKNGVKKSDKHLDNTPIYPCKFFNIEISNEQINDSINKRVEIMFENGLVNEVRQLLKEYPTSLHAFKGIGYKQVIEDLQENKTEKEMIEDVSLATRQYAKRQRTFLRHQFPNIINLSKDKIYDYVYYDVNRRLRNKASIKPICLNNIEKQNVLVVGVGGVGSITCSSLVRLGVNKITIVDKDVVDVSNLNRQILYTRKDIGLKKVEACKNKLLELDEHLNITTICDFYNDNLVNEDITFVIDCIDDTSAKANLALYCLNHNIPFISATGSGLRLDSTKYCIGTLFDTGEPLAKAYKKALAKKGFTDFKKIKVAYSKEVPQKRITSYVGSNVACPNGEGLAIISYFIDFNKSN